MHTCQASLGARGDENGGDRETEVTGNSVAGMHEPSASTIVSRVMVDSLLNIPRLSDDHPQLNQNGISRKVRRHAACRVDIIPDPQLHLLQDHQG
jgi:hypothetical protein